MTSIINDINQSTIEGQAEDKRNYVFDFLRIFACFMVIINHTNSWIFNKYFPSVSGQISLFLFFLSKTGVPLFFMISGSLLLGKRDGFRIAYGKRALRILIDIVIFSILTTCLIRRDLSAFSLEFFVSLVQRPCIVSYWYLYSYLSLMLLLPFLQHMVSAMSSKDFAVFLGITFLVKQGSSFLPVLGFPVSISGFFSDNFFSGGIFYLLMGYYISNYVVKWIDRFGKGKTAVCLTCSVLLIGGILFSWFLTGQEYYQNGKFVLKLDNVYNLPITVYSTALFLLALLLFQKRKISKSVAKIVCTISQATFGVYLIHNVGIMATRRILNFLCTKINDLLAVLIMDVFIFSACTILIVLIRKIPGMKKIL